MTSVDVDTWWRRLESAALVGTARRPAPSVTEVELGGADTLEPRANARPEEVALDAAAVGAALRRAGQLAGTGTAMVPAAPPEGLAEAPVPAGQLLDLLLSQPPTDATGTEALIVHWCTTCHAAGYHVPHRLLPALLDRAASMELRRQVSVVVGERGGWLAGQNPAWSWLSGAQRLQASMDDIEEKFGRAASVADAGTVGGRREPQVDPHLWARQATEQRVSQLFSVRRNDPAAGRDLLLTTWSRDPAKDRRALLEALQVNLGADDEDFLEAALDDRAASVRDLAAELLDGLPGSRRATRMAERLRPLLREVGRLRRHLEVGLPDDPDAGGRRDGLGTPPPGRSARGWWLERIVAGAPFTVWGGPPEDVVPRIKDPDVLAGLRTAAVARRSPEWARALLDQGVQQGLLRVLPPEEREARVVEALGRVPPNGMLALLQTLPLSWSPRSSASVVARLARLKPAEIGPVLAALMPRLVRGLHPDAVPALQRWRAQAQLPPRLDDQLGSLIQSRTLRHSISEAFRT